MRELAIEIDYEPGVDILADVFIEHPNLQLESLDIGVDDGIVRADHVSGPPEALDAFREPFLEQDLCNECIVPHDQCDAERTYHVIDSGPNTLTVYTYHEGVTYCHSVPYHATLTLRPGTLYHSHRRGPTNTWRVLIRDDEHTTELYDALVGSLPDGLSMSFQHLTEPQRWGRTVNQPLDLPPEQRATIERAVEMSYYDYPHGVSLGDLAADLGVPQSTARYRLRRAERELATSFIDR